MAPFIVFSPMLSLAPPDLTSDLLGSRNIRAEFQRRRRYFSAARAQHNRRYDRRDHDRTINSHPAWPVLQTLFGSRRCLGYLVRPSQIKDGGTCATVFGPNMVRFCHFLLHYSKLRNRVADTFGATVGATDGATDGATENSTAQPWPAGAGASRDATTCSVAEAFCAEIIRGGAQLNSGDQAGSDAKDGVGT
jgi:hypothetical protein